jgi:hypothetical protein
MAVDFILQPASFSIPTMPSLRTLWNNIPNPKVRDSICQEYQYLQFHQFLLDNLRHTTLGKASSPPYAYKINWTVRAGAIKASILLCGSIAEAALRAHAEKRGYPLHSNLRSRTFGNVLKAWKPGTVGHHDISAIWADLTSLQDTRNNIHLFKAANDPNADYKQVLANEEQILKNANTILAALAAISSP